MKIPSKALIALVIAVAPIQGFAQATDGAKFVKPDTPNTTSSKRLSAYPDCLTVRGEDAKTTFCTKGTAWVVESLIAFEHLHLRKGENVKASIRRIARPLDYFRNLEPDALDAFVKDNALVNGPAGSRKVAQFISERRDINGTLTGLSAVVLEKGNQYKFVQLKLIYSLSSLTVAETAVVISAPGTNFEPTPDLLEVHQAFEENIRHRITVTRK